MGAGIHHHLTCGLREGIRIMVRFAVLFLIGGAVGLAIYLYVLRKAA